MSAVQGQIVPAFPGVNISKKGGYFLRRAGDKLQSFCPAGHRCLQIYDKTR
jgi:hypothetical protein